MQLVGNNSDQLRRRNATKIPPVDPTMSNISLQASEPLCKKSRPSSIDRNDELVSFYAQLIRWLEPQGATGLHHVDISESVNLGRGLVTTAELKAGSILFSIPQAVIISPLSIDASLRQTLSSFPRVFVFNVYLSLARQNANHAVHRYASLLPDEPPNAAWWPDTARIYFSGTNLAFAVDKTRRELEENWTRACIEHPDVMASVALSSVQWAAGMYDSRRCPLSVATARSATTIAESSASLDGLGAMVPFFDITNHDRQPNARFFYVDESLNVELSADLPAGSDLAIDYGSKGNEELLMSYGFAIQDNPNDTYRFLLTATEPPPAPPKRLGPFQLHLSQNELAPQFPNALWRALADPMGYVHHPEADGLDDSSVEIDLEHADFLEASLSDKLKKLHDLQEKFTFRHGNEVDPRARFIGWYFDGQRKVLEEAISALQSMMSEAE